MSSKIKNKLNAGRSGIKASSPIVLSSPKKSLGTFRHRNPFTGSDSEESEFDAEAAECCSETSPPMKRAHISDATSGSPFLPESTLLKLPDPRI